MSSTINNILWKFAERSSVQVVSLVISIILARLLTPDDYGIVAMVAIFVTLSYVLVDGGFNSALIQKKDADIVDFSSVFFFTLFFSIVIYISLFFLASFISDFYDNKYSQLTLVVRILGLQVIIYGVNSIQLAYISRKMLFKNLFWSSIVGTSISAVVGLIMAYNGYGVWSIVTQQLLNTSINTITLYFITRFHPKAKFSFQRLKGLLDYGIKLFGANMMITIFQELRSIIIGKIYSAKDLALFDRGRQFPWLIVNNINVSIGAVLFPAMSQRQDSLDDIRLITRKSIRFSSFAISPLMILLVSCSEPLIRLVLTDKWIGCVPLMQWFCLIYLFQPIHTANLQALKAIGRSDICLKLEIIKKIIELISLFLVMYISVTAIVVNMAILTTLFTAINAYPNRTLLNYTYTQQIKDIFMPILLSSLACLPIWIINPFLGIGDIYKLIINIISSLLIYILLSIWCNNQELKYLKSIIKNHNASI